MKIINEKCIFHGYCSFETQVITNYKCCNLSVHITRDFCARSIANMRLLTVDLLMHVVVFYKYKLLFFIYRDKHYFLS